MRRLKKIGWKQRRLRKIVRCAVCYRIWGGRRAEAPLRHWVFYDGQWRCPGCRRPLSAKTSD